MTDTFVTDTIDAFDTDAHRAGRIARKPVFVVLVPGATVPAELDASSARHAGVIAQHWTDPNYMGFPAALICFVEPDGSLTDLGVFSQGGR